MCAIAGQYNHNGPNLLQMAHISKHRGPDSSNVYIKDKLAVAFNRLAIVGGVDQQYPFVSGDWAVWLNGCIYNHKKLTKGCVGLKTACDGESVAYMIDLFGISIVSQFDGMFSIVAYNTKTEDCYLIRDRYGIKPMYYTRDSRPLFGSEIKAILVQKPAEVNLDAVKQWFSYQTYFDELTLFKGIYLLDPGTYINLKTMQRTKYWKWEFTNEITDQKKATEKVRHLMQRAVKKQQLGGYTPSLWLSGGIDSHIIASLLPQTHAFTSAMDVPEYNESIQACKIAGYYNHEYHNVIATKGKMITEMEKAIYYLEDLRAGPSWSNYILAMETGMYSKVNMQGTGGDELFRGYTWRYEDDYNNNRTSIESYNHIVDNQELYDCNHFLPSILMVGDKMAGAFGYEDRVPFLDNDLVDYVTRLHKDLRHDKKVLRDAFDMPEQKKLGFTSPDAYYFKHDQHLCEQIAAGNYRQYMQYKVNEENIPAMWCAYAFNTWHKIFIEK